MSQTKTHEAVVGDQFGARADAYLKSPVHAQGMGLEDLVDIVRGRRDARALDLGCGGGHVTFNFAPHVREVVAYDLSRPMLDVVARTASERGLVNVKTEQGVAEHLPFADASFDIVASRVSAHHWLDMDAGLREAHRVLKPSGRAILVDAVSPGHPLLDTWLQAIELLRDPSHVRDYSRAEWEAAFARAGFMVETVRAYRVRIEYGSWIARMNTPSVQADAIRALYAQMSETVRRHFAVEADGSFTLDIALFDATKPT